MAFFSQLGSVQTLDEIRFPLAEIFLWIQVLHSFDLPEAQGPALLAGGPRWR